MATASMIKVYVSYGFMSGPAHGKRFTKALRQAGYSITTNAQEADIIVAHSAGCWLVPSKCQPKLIMYVGMPLRQNDSLRTWRKANAAAFRRNFWRSVLNIGRYLYYFFTRPRHNGRIIRMTNGALPVTFAGTTTIFAANRYDPWVQSPDLAKEVTINPQWSFISMRGAHNDIWYHSQDYVEIIDHYARLLA